MDITIQEVWEGLGLCPCETEHCEEKKEAIRALVRVAVHDALEKARNSVPSYWKINLDYIEKIDMARIDALGEEDS